MENLDQALNFRINSRQLVKDLLKDFFIIAWRNKRFLPSKKKDPWHEMSTQILVALIENGVIQGKVGEAGEIEYCSVDAQYLDRIIENIIKEV